MKKQMVCLFIWLIAGVNGFAQNAGLMDSMKDALRTDGKISAEANKMLYGIPRPAGIIEGDSYLDTTFWAANIRLFNDENTYNNIPSRFDLKSNVLEIKTPEGIRVVDGNRIKFFTLANPLKPNGTIMMNTQNFKDDAEKLKGFFELLVDGKTTLLMHHKAWIKQPTYNEALGAGDINAKVIKEKHFYLAKGDKVQKLTLSKKGILEALNDRRADIEQLLKSGDYNYKSPADLIKIISYYNN